MKLVGIQCVYRSILREYLSGYGESLSLKRTALMYRLHEAPLLYRDAVHIRDFNSYAGVVAGTQVSQA